MEEKYFNKMNEDYQDWLNNRNNSIGKEKTADEMFEELGWVRGRKDKKDIFYLKRCKVICFDVDTKEIIKCAEIGLDYLAVGITFQELQAINKKCKEMNWI